MYSLSENSRHRWIVEFFSIVVIMRLLLGNGRDIMCNVAYKKWHAENPSLINITINFIGYLWEQIIKTFILGQTRMLHCYMKLPGFIIYTNLHFLKQRAIFLIHYDYFKQFFDRLPIVLNQPMHLNTDADIIGRFHLLQYTKYTEANWQFSYPQFIVSSTWGNYLIYYIFIT